MKTILLIEDNTEVRENTAEILELANFKVLQAENGKVGVELAGTNKPDLIICDIMMPLLDGYGVIHMLSKNAETSTIPFIFLTAKSLKEDIVKGLKLGADDYITKPFDPEVLILRINNILKRAYSSANEEYHISKSILKFNTLELISGKKKEKLTLKEAQLLRYFILNKNKILTREDILTEIWGEDDYFLGRSMDVFISRLRKYLSEDKGIDIRTVRGTGFILEEVTNQKEKEED